MTGTYYDLTVVLKDHFIGSDFYSLVYSERTKGDKTSVAYEADFYSLVYSERTKGDKINVVHEATSRMYRWDVTQMRHAPASINEPFPEEVNVGSLVLIPKRMTQWGEVQLWTYFLLGAEEEGKV